MEHWEDIAISKMEKQLAGVNEKDLRFFRIEELRRNIRRTGKFATTCRRCQQTKGEVESALAHINEAVSVPGQYRREVDRLITCLANHMMKEHGFYPPWHFNYLYSFLGMVAGTLVSFAAVMILPGKPWELLAAGFAAGLITGQVAGGRKDRKIREDNKLM